MKDEKLLIPKYRFKSIIDVTHDDLKNMGAKAIGLDIDNVIAPDGTFRYIDGIKDWVNNILAEGIKITIISNGTIFRVRKVSDYLGGLPFIHLSLKPSPKSLIKAAERMNVDITEMAMLGDQLFSDIKAANRCGAIPVRIDPIEAKSLYPHYYAWKKKREKPYLELFEKMRGNTD